MSERGSFVTQFFYCADCFKKIKKVLCKSDKYLYGRQVEKLPIIAGKLGSCGPYSDTVMFQYNLFNKDNAPCHPVKVALVPDSAYARILVVMPNGRVEDYEDVDECRF